MDGDPQTAKTRKVNDHTGFSLMSGGDGGIRTLDTGFAGMLP